MDKQKKKLKYEESYAAFGVLSANLNQIVKILNVKAGQKAYDVSFSGADSNTLDLANKVWLGLKKLIQKGINPAPWDVEWLIGFYQENFEYSLDELFDFSFEMGHLKIFPKTLTQKLYLQKIKKNDLVFGLGPAGTGKTFLAVAMAIATLNNNEVKRLVITRPAVEAGENLGFLPGDLEEKINPYLRPLYDALANLMPYEKYLKLVEKRVIEVAPLAFMRGRTLTDAFVILDEAQNCTREQIKMFLTRLGPNSKAVITGDPSQSDLKLGAISGLKEIANILGAIEGIEFCYFKSTDVIRHRLVKKIIEAYEKYEMHR